MNYDIKNKASQKLQRTLHVSETSRNLPRDMLDLRFYIDMSSLSVIVSGCGERYPPFGSTTNTSTTPRQFTQFGELESTD